MDKWCRKWLARGLQGVGVVMIPSACICLIALAATPASQADDRIAFEFAFGGGAHSGVLATTELRGFVGSILGASGFRPSLHAVGYQLRLEFAPLLYVHSVDRWRALAHAHHFTATGLIGERRRLFWSGGIGVAFNAFGVGPEVEGRVAYALTRHPRLRCIIGLYSRVGFAISYHQIPTMAAGVFVGLFRF